MLLKGLRTVLSLGLLAVLVMGSSRWVKSTGFAGAWISDPHYGEVGWGVPQRTGMDSLVAWLERQVPRPEFLVIDGDWTVGTDAPDEGRAFGDTVCPALRALGIAPVPVLGNHDVTGYAGPSYGGGSNPFAFAEGLFPNLFRGRSYYTVKYNTVRLLVMNNLDDTCTLSDVGDTIQAYWQCNPPGYNKAYFGGKGSSYINPSFSGWDDTTSAQWVWARQILDARGSDWVIPCFHRSIYTPTQWYNWRPLYYGARLNQCKVFEDRGLPLVTSGDVHDPGFSRPIKGGALDPTGTVYMTLKGRYASRICNMDTLTSSWWVYPPVDSIGLMLKRAYGAYVRFYGDAARIQYVAASGSDVPSVVADTTIKRVR